MIEKLENERASMVADGSYINWIDLLQNSRYMKEFLQHIFTGRHELFDLLSNVVLEGKECRSAQLRVNNGEGTEAELTRMKEELREQYRKLQPQQKSCHDQIERLTKAVMTSGELLNGCCSGCITMFDPEDAIRFEQQFVEIENSPLYKLRTTQS